MPNFYWNNSRVHELTVTGDLTVEGNTVLQALQAAATDLLSTLQVAGLSSLADLDAANVSLSGTLGVNGTTTLGTVNVQALSVYASMALAQTKRFYLSGAGGADAQFFVGTDNHLHLETYDGSSTSPIFDIALPSVGPNLNISANVSGNSIGSDGLHLIYSNYTAHNMAAGSTFTPTAGWYLIRAGVTGIQFYPNVSGAANPLLAAGQMFVCWADGTTHFVNTASGSSLLEVYSLN